MSKHTASAAGGALPKIDRKTIMTRAWAIFRETYRYPQIKFADIGKFCAPAAFNDVVPTIQPEGSVNLFTPFVSHKRLNNRNAMKIEQSV